MFTLTLPSSEGGSCPNSPTTFSNEENEPKNNDAKVELRTNKSSAYRGQRKSKHIPGIESLPEGMPLESVSSSSGSSKKPPPSPLNLRQDYSSEGEINEPLSSPGSQENSKITKLRKTSTPATVSVPNSPSKHFEFFGDFESDDLSSGDFSEPTTPQRRLSTKSRNLAIQREEIKKKYLELQKKLHREFEAKQMEWERIRPATVALSNSPIHMLLKDDSSPTLKSSPTNPITEENLPPDFKKKLNEWRTKVTTIYYTKEKLLTVFF
jgi:serine/arginine repetitive matrix protein 2